MTKKYNKDQLYYPSSINSHPYRYVYTIFNRYVTIMVTICSRRTLLIVIGIQSHIFMVLLSSIFLSDETFVPDLHHIIIHSHTQNIS